MSCLKISVRRGDCAKDPGNILLHQILREQGISDTILLQTLDGIPELVFQIPVEISHRIRADSALQVLLFPLPAV